ncbi:hypothetical protein Tco_1145157 [Tanacetum coccineum]
MDEERDKVELFGSCSRGIVEMDEVDREKFVEKGFKHKKIEETHVDIDGDCEGDGKDRELESNESSPMDVNGAENCEEDGKGHESESIRVVNDNIDLKNHVEEVIGNKEVMDLVDFGCSKSVTIRICSCMSENSDSEAMRVKHIMVNSSNTNRNSNFNKVEISREEFEDIDVLVSDLMLGKTERCSWGLDHIDDSDVNLDYDCSLVHTGTILAKNELIVPKTCGNVALVGFDYGVLDFGTWDIRRF